MRALLAFLLVTSFASSGDVLAVGVPRSDVLRDFRHTAWTTADGAPAQIRAIAQSADGWLWLGTSDGLYRFDGLVFERRELPTRGLLARGLIINLYAADNGDLWIAHMGDGLSVLRADGRLEDIPTPPDAALGPIGAMASDPDGSVWVIGSAGMYHFAGGTWRAVATGQEWSSSEAQSLLQDQYGQLWAANDSKVYLLDRSSGHLRPVVSATSPATSTAASTAAMGGSLLQSPDGRVWVTSAGRAAQVFPAAGVPDRPARARANQAESRWRGQFDRAGNFWSLRCPTGVCLLAATGDGGRAATRDAASAGERLVAPAHISGLAPSEVLEDREGNIWIVSENGLDRYQPNAVRRSSVPGPGAALSLAVDTGGVAWVANSASAQLWRLDGAGPPVLQENQPIRIVSKARDGALLLVGRRTIERRAGRRTEHIALPPARDGAPAGLNVLGVNDDGKVLWMASTESGLMGYVDGKWLPRAAFAMPAKTIIATPGEIGQLWIADGDGGLSRYGGGPARRYDAAATGFASGVFYQGAAPGVPMTVVLSGAQGTGVLRGGVFRMLRAADADVLRKITGMAVAANGDRWLNGWRGLVRVSAADWQHAISHPDDMLKYELVGALDGYPGQATSANRLPSLVLASGGQLWASGSGGLVRLDTGAPRRNLVAPRIVIGTVSTPHGSHAGTAQGDVRLPPGEQDIDIAFTAPALRRPENLHYEYWLEGLDQHWRDGGNRRLASYTGVPPGDYRFHVRVHNEDGVPGAAVATRQLTVTPTILQTVWFKLACGALLALLLAALYRYRVRVLTARLAERLRVRASERERIARTLHDTYLQSVHVLLLRVGAVAHSLPADHPLRARMTTLLDDATSVVVEGRGQVEQLRAAAPASIDEIVQRATAALARCYPEVSLRMRTRGTVRPIKSAVLEEAGEIITEAVRNAYLHAGARLIEVETEHGATLIIRVCDNGAGFDAQILQDGHRSGHWGLIGMRERARQIGAVLAVANSAGGGAQVTLQVPAALAYAKKRWRWLP